jgi:L-alanine-DL-glutamate epimerase-like enolase superfamily enzyme
MTVKRVDIWHLKLAFLSPIKHNLATHQGSENVVAKVATTGGVVGYGEGVPRIFVTGETLSESLDFIMEMLAPAAFKLNWASPQDLMASLEAAHQNLGAANFPAAFCAWEMAILDAAGKTWGMAVSDFFGPRITDQVIYSAVLPIAPPEQMADLFDLVKTHHVRFLKMKVGGAGDLERLRMAREKLGWEVDLRVDANTAWSAAEAIERLRQMKPYKISAVEQPVAKDDFEGLKRVGEETGLPVIADESLCTPEDAQRLIEMKACQIFNLRLSKCGGLGRTHKLQQMAVRAGLRCQLGCHVGETSILSAAGRHFAVTHPNLTYVEGSLSPFLLLKDPVATPVTFNREGIGPPLPGPGLGVEVLDQMLNELAISRKIIS